MNHSLSTLVTSGVCEWTDRGRPSRVRSWRLVSWTCAGETLQTDGVPYRGVLVVGRTYSRDPSSFNNESSLRTNISLFESQYGVEGGKGTTRVCRLEGLNIDQLLIPPLFYTPWPFPLPPSNPLCLLVLSLSTFLSVVHRTFFGLVWQRVQRLTFCLTCLTRGSFSSV